jgi:hypothetical protein
MRSPRFRAKDVSTCMGSSTARGPASASQLRRADVAFSSAERDRHLGIRPVSQLYTQPVVSPVNASRRPLRVAAHHSGSGRLARPYPVENLHLLSLASFPGALRLGSEVPIPPTNALVRISLTSRPPATEPTLRLSFSAPLCRQVWRWLETTDQMLWPLCLGQPGSQEGRQPRMCRPGTARPPQR